MSAKSLNLQAESYLALLEKNLVEFLQTKKNLLAFSHGSDSSALFYLLSEENVEFDCAFVNYHSRTQSDEEERSAREICAKFDKKIFVFDANLELKSSNYESVARDIRHKFFREICEKEGYETLILAHQLNDKFEWFLMQLSKGSGLVNLLSFAKVESVNSLFIVRPLIETSKDEINAYLKDKNIRYFLDSSNLDLGLKRNFFRHEFGDKFVSKFAQGLKRSFEYLEEDKNSVLGEFEFENGEFFIIKKDKNSINLIDKALKISGILMSSAQRNECKKDCVISGKICVVSSKQCYYVAPFIRHDMPKKFKEFCRLNQIPTLIRPYIFLNQQLCKFWSRLSEI